MADQQAITFNGINGASGDYLLPKMEPYQVSKIIQREKLDPAHLAELKQWWQRISRPHFAPAEGLDARNLGEVGWGVIFAHNSDPEIREALSPLLEHRRKQATAEGGDYYKEYAERTGYRPHESKRDFLARFKVSTGPADPKKVPYYLLIVGDPETIPYRFQCQLDVQYGVGRIHFETLDEYARYARSVVEAETVLPKRARTGVFFGVANDNDPATNLSATHLVKPLAGELISSSPEWNLITVLAKEANKARLGSLLGGPETPAFLFTASHGVGFPNGHPLQLSHQGALLCQDWPGPHTRHQAISRDFYLAADDIGDDASLSGLICFHFACYAAGTPREDDFAQQLFGAGARPEIAPFAFLAKLPQRLLAHPRGGALAVVGHVERAWGYSFFCPTAGRQLETFRSTIQRLLSGFPVGYATEYLNQRYAELTTDLSIELEDIRFGKIPDDLELTEMWTSNNDARDYVVIGDPAVRLQVDSLE